MAIFRPILGELSGSIGDNTFSHNRGGAYVRRRAVPVNPTTAKQTAARAALGTISSRWNTLTDAQRANWAAWASLNPFLSPLGDTRQVTGIAAYVALNARLLTSGGPSTVNDDPPVGVGPDELTGLAVTPTAPDSLSLAWTSGALAADERLLFWMTLPSTSSRDPNFNQARLVGYGPLADVTPTVFTTPYEFAAGNAFNCFIQRMNGSGLVSPIQKVRVVVP